MSDKQASAPSIDTAREEIARLTTVMREHGGKTQEAYARAFDLLGQIMPRHTDEAVKFFGDIIKTTEWNSAHMETITPRAINAFDTLAGMDSNQNAARGLEILMSYARHHMADRRIVIEKAGEAITRRAETTTRHDSKFIPTMITKLVDTARIYQDEGLLAPAFTAGWNAVTHIHPARTDDCQSIIYRMYGVASRSDTTQDYIQTGRAALPEMMEKNRSAIIMAARSLEQASMHALHGEMFFSADKKGFLTPAFARTGVLDAKDKERWFFPSKGGRWGEDIVTMVSDHFDGARQEMMVPPDTGARALTRIQHVGAVFADMARGIVTPERAAERIGVTAAHLTMEAWK